MGLLEAAVSLFRRFVINILGNSYRDWRSWSHNLFTFSNNIIVLALKKAEKVPYFSKFSLVFQL